MVFMLCGSLNAILRQVLWFNSTKKTLPTRESPQERHHITTIFQLMCLGGLHGQQEKGVMLGVDF